MPNFAGRFLGPGDGDQTGLGLDQHIVRFLVPVRPRGSIAGKIAENKTRIFFAQLRSDEAEPLSGPRRQILNKNVRLLQQAMQNQPGVRMLQIQRQGFLGTIEPHKVAGQSSHGRVIAAREVSDLGAFDLYHARAQIGQLPGGEGRGDCLLQGDDRDSRERQHQYDLGRPRTCSAK